MKEIYIEKNKPRLFLLVSVFFFIRTALMSPTHCFLMNADYPYFRFSVESIVFMILLIIFSAMSAKLAFAFRAKAGDIAGLIYIVAMSDPLFFGTQDNPLKLFVNIIIQLLIHNALSEKKLIKTDLFFLISLFVSTFLVPYSIFGYTPVMLSIYALAGRKGNNSNSNIRVVSLGLICAVAGFLINRLLIKNVVAFAEFYNSFVFADISGINKTIDIIKTLVPMVAFAALFFSQYKRCIKASKQKNKVKNNYEIVIDAFFFPALISIIAIFFTAGEGFCAVNIIVPSVILTLLCLKDEHCINAVKNISEIVTKNKTISIIIFIIIFAIATDGILNYHSEKQMIFYIRY